MTPRYDDPSSELSLSSDRISVLSFITLRQLPLLKSFPTFEIVAPLFSFLQIHTFDSRNEEILEGDQVLLPPNFSNPFRRGGVQLTPVSLRRVSAGDLQVEFADEV
jgi:hypothetical protein